MFMKVADVASEEVTVELLKVKAAQQQNKTSQAVKRRDKTQSLSHYYNNIRDYNKTYGWLFVFCHQRHDFQLKMH